MHIRLIGSNTVVSAKAGSMNSYSIKYHICNDYLTLIMLHLDIPCCHFTLTLFKVYTDHLNLVIRDIFIYFYLAVKSMHIKNKLK